MRPPHLLLLALLCALASLPLAPRASAYQHITNGSFEDGMSGWGVGTGASPSVTADGASDGARALRVDAGDRVRIAQPLANALPAGTYVLAYTARTSAGTGAVIATVNSLASPTAVFRDSGAITASGMKATVTFTVAIATEASLTLVITAPQEGWLVLDNVRIEGAPPVTFTPTATTTTPAATATSTPTSGATATVDTLSPTPEAIALPITGIIRNAGFEERDDEGAPVAWEQYGGALSSAAAARTGAYAARIESTTDSTKWMHQAVTVNDGATYAFSAWVQHNDPAVARALLRVSWYTSADGSGSNIGSEDSTEILDTSAPGYRYLTTGPITAPAEARSARVRVLLAPVSATPAVIFVDDAAFGPAAPLPPTQVAQATAPAVAGSAPAEPAPQRSGVSGNRSRGTSAFVAGAAVAPPAGARIVINEVLYDAAGDGPDAEGEWVELYNAGTAAANLAGWLLADASSADVLPSFSLEPSAYVVVSASDSILQIRPDLAGRVIVLGGRIGNGLGNDGDTLLLVAPDGAWADAVSWGDDTSALNPSVGDVPEGHSIERSPAGFDTGRASDFADNASPSPGGPIGSAPVRPQPDARPRVEILAGDSAAFAWLPWAIAAASLAALAAFASWRAVDVVRQRVRP